MQIATCHAMWWHSVSGTYFSDWVGIGFVFCRPFSEPSSKFNSTPYALLSTVLARLFKDPFLCCDDISLRPPCEPLPLPCRLFMTSVSGLPGTLLSGVASLGPCPSLDVVLCQRNGSGEVSFLRDWMSPSVLILLSFFIGFQLDVQIGHHFPAALEAGTHCSLLVSREAWSHSDSWSYCFFGGLVCLWYQLSSFGILNGSVLTAALWATGIFLIILLRHCLIMYPRLDLNLCLLLLPSIGITGIHHQSQIAQGI